MSSASRFTAAVGWTYRWDTASWAVCLASCLGTFLVCLAGVAIGALSRQDRVAAEQEGVWVALPPEAGDHDVTLRWRATSFVHGSEVSLVSLAPVGRGPVPPGIPRLPRVGDAYVSPAFAQDLDDPANRWLRIWLHARVAGVISDNGLRRPDQRLAYVGVAPAEPGNLGAKAVFATPRQTAEVVREFKARTSNAGGFALVLGLVGVGVVAPCLLLVATSVRLGSDRRLRRYAALWLSGASIRDVRSASGRSALLPAATGSLTGVSMSLVLIALSRQRSDLFLSVRGFPWLLAAGMALGMPAIAMRTSREAVAWTPAAAFALVRGVSPKPGKTAGPQLFACGLIALLMTKVFGVDSGSPVGAILLALGLPGLLLGASATAPWLVAHALGAVAKVSMPLSASLAANRIGHNPRYAIRSLTATALFVMVAIIVQALAGSTASVGASEKPSGSESVLLVRGPSGVNRHLAALPGVKQVQLTSPCAPGDGGCEWQIHTDGAAEVEGELQAELGWSSVVRTVREASAENARFSRGDHPAVLGLLTLLFACSLLATTLSLALSTADGIASRRATITALRCFGTPPGLIRRSLVLEAVVPNLAAGALAVPAGLGTLGILSWIGGRWFAPDWTLLGVDIGVLVICTSLVAAVALLTFRNTADLHAINAT